MFSMMVLELWIPLYGLVVSVMVILILLKYIWASPENSKQVCTTCYKQLKFTHKQDLFKMLDHTLHNLPTDLILLISDYTVLNSLLVKYHAFQFYNVITHEEDFQKCPIQQYQVGPILNFGNWSSHEHPYDKCYQFIACDNCIQEQDKKYFTYHPEGVDASSLLS